MESCIIVCSNVVCDGDVACFIPMVLTKSLFVFMSLHCLIVFVHLPEKQRL